jgi:hypothetical protein
MLFMNVPARNDLPWYYFKTTLSGAIYTLRFRYNSRMQRWIMDVADASNNDVIVGCPVLLLRDVFGQYVVAGLPPGLFFASDDTNAGNQPTRFSFGTDHTLWYEDPTQ